MEADVLYISDFKAGGTFYAIKRVYIYILYGFYLGASVFIWGKYIGGSVFYRGEIR